MYQLVTSLSGGEKTKLYLAKLLLQNPSFLLLDESTNHLEIATREVIEQALADFKGALLIVSHDRYFLEQIGITKQLHLDGGSLVQVYE